jgi:hypothetical protein
VHTTHRLDRPFVVMSDTKHTTFSPLLYLNDDLPNYVRAFLVVVDLPVYQLMHAEPRLDHTDAHDVDVEESTYYVDEQLLLRILKPSQRRPRPIHSLDSVQHMIDPPSIRSLQGVSTAQVSTAQVSTAQQSGATHPRIEYHFSTVSRDRLFAHLSAEDREIVETTWGLRRTGRKTTLLSLDLLLHHVSSLDQSLCQTVDAVVRARLGELRRTSAPSAILRDHRSYPSFDDWWRREASLSCMLRNYEASSLALLLWWRTAHHETFDDENNDIMHGCLWTSSNVPAQSIALNDALLYFHEWYDDNLRTSISHQLGVVQSPWTTDDDRPAHQVPVRKRRQ